MVSLLNLVFQLYIAGFEPLQFAFRIILLFQHLDENRSRILELFLHRTKIVNKLHSRLFKDRIVSLDEIGAVSLELSGVFYFIEKQIILLFQFHRRLEIFIELLNLNTLELLNRLVNFLVDFVRVYFFTLQALFLQILFIHLMIRNLLVFWELIIVFHGLAYHVMQLILESLIFVANLL